MLINEKDSIVFAKCGDTKLHSDSYHQVKYQTMNFNYTLQKTQYIVTLRQSTEIILFSFSVGEITNTPVFLQLSKSAYSKITVKKEMCPKILFT